MASKPVRAGTLFLANEVWSLALKGIRERRTVTRIVLEPRPLYADEPVIELELRVTKIDGVAIPRNLKKVLGS